MLSTQKGGGAHGYYRTTNPLTIYAWPISSRLTGGVPSDGSVLDRRRRGWFTRSRPRPSWVCYQIPNSRRKLGPDSKQYARLLHSRSCQIPSSDSHRRSAIQLLICPARMIRPCSGTISAITQSPSIRSCIRLATAAFPIAGGANAWI